MLRSIEQTDRHTDIQTDRHTDLQSRSVPAEVVLYALQSSELPYSVKWFIHSVSVSVILLWLLWLLLFIYPW